jgi:hypothetical protein
MFLAHFEACSQESGFAHSLGPAQREALRRVMKAEIVNYGFSDSVIIAVALEAKPSDPTPVNGVWQTLLAVGTTATLSLAAKHPLRAGIDVGVAVRVSDHEIYGAALERAYTLESHCAQHPRIVVGQELLSYLRQVKDQPHDTTEAQIGSLRAESALRFIFQDADGHPALDYLGSEVHDVVAASLTPATVQQAYDFVVSEQARWRAGGNEGRADRYRKVREYFESRAELWGIATR